jgi:hypothetical protein
MSSSRTVVKSSIIARDLRFSALIARLGDLTGDILVGSFLVGTASGFNTRLGFVPISSLCKSRSKQSSVK